MKRRKVTFPLLLLVICLLWNGCGRSEAEPAETARAAETDAAAADTETQPENGEGEEMTETEEPRDMTISERAAALRGELWEKYRETEKQDAERKAEDEKRDALPFGITAVPDLSKA